MFRGAVAFVAVMLVAVSVPLRASAQAIEGTWLVTHVVNGNRELSVAVVKLNIDGAKTSGELVSSVFGNKLKLKSVTQESGWLRIVMSTPDAELVYEGPVPKKANEELAGNLAIDAKVYPAAFSSAGDTTLDQKTPPRMLDCPPLKEIQALAFVGQKLRNQARGEKDEKAKAELLKEANEADQTAKKRTPELYREVVSKHADGPMVFEAILALMRTAKANDAKVDDVKAWGAVGMKSANAYGPRFQTDFAAQMGTVLIGQEGYLPLAVEYAREAEKGLTPKMPAADHVRVLTLLSRALRKSGKEEEAKALDVRFAKVDLLLDEEYLAKMPGFTGTKFAGRKGKSERAVLMELFTGASCGFCFSADLAFDVLMKSYQPNELVLIQYHVHIPAPDPLTNADTEARWNYYRKAFPEKVKGAPTSIFDGKPNAGGGGLNLPAAEKKYRAYRSVIDDLIEEDAGAKITASATRDGDKVDIRVKVTGLNEPGASKKLRILLAEETVRFVGSNRIRLHHNVVRAFPGGVEGKSLTEAGTKHSVSINIGELRGNLEKYLNNSGKVFANPARPLAMEHLRVIAFVQDDATQEILQAAMVEVSGNK
jgi:hypothetical protein